MLSDDDHRATRSSAISAATRGTPAPQFPPARWTASRPIATPRSRGSRRCSTRIQDFRTFHEALSAFGESLNLGGDAAAEEGYRARARRARLEPHPPALSEAVLRRCRCFSFAEDTTSPFAGAVDKASHVRTSGAAAGRARSAGQRDRRAASATSRASTSTAKTRRVADASSRSSSRRQQAWRAEVQAAQEDPGRQRHLRLRQRAGRRAVGPADAGCRRSAAARCSRSTSSTPTRRRSTKARSRIRGRTISSPRSRWCRSRRAVRDCSSRSAAACERSLERCPITGTSLAELQSAGAVSALIGATRLPVPRSRRARRLPRAFASRSAAGSRSATGKAFNLAIATNTGISADLLRIEGTLTPKDAQFRLPDARRDRDAQPRLVRQLHREDPAEGRAARGLRRRRRASRVERGSVLTKARFAPRARAARRSRRHRRRPACNRRRCRRCRPRPDRASD